LAVTCARCGTPNPDGNQFCQACGTPLTAAVAGPPPGAIPGPPPGAPPPPPTSAPPGPPPGLAPPGPPPGIQPPHPYQNPYYTPSEVGPQPTVHRTPWILIGGAVVALIVVMAGCGAAFALIGNQASKQSSTGIAPSPLPSPSPTGSPNPSASPTASPAASPTPIQTTGGTESNAGVTVPVPSGWVLYKKDDQGITLISPSGDGSITVASGASVPAQTAQQNKDTVVAVFIQNYPDTKNCPGSQTTTGALDGAQGIFWQLCYTQTSGGQSVAIGAPMFAGANADGSAYYVVILKTSYSNMDSFTAEAKPILSAIQWKLK
jgi:hypothetical protein